MEKIKVPTIKNDSIITIQLSGSFYRSLQDVLQHLTEQRDPQDITNFIEKLNIESKDLSDWERACETIMILCAEVEKKAQEQDLITEIEIDAPTENDLLSQDETTTDDIEVIQESNQSVDQSPS